MSNYNTKSWKVNTILSINILSRPKKSLHVCNEKCHIPNVIWYESLCHLSEVQLLVGSQAVYTWVMGVFHLAPT